MAHSSAIYNKSIVCIVTNIGSYDRQYQYDKTQFAEFDRFLYSSWEHKPNGRGKNQVEYGVSVE